MVFDLLHSFGVWFSIFSTRFECSFSHTMDFQSSNTRPFLVFKKENLKDDGQYNAEFSKYIFLGKTHSFGVWFWFFTLVSSVVSRSSPLVSSVVLGTSSAVPQPMKRNVSCMLLQTQQSGSCIMIVNTHSKRVEKMRKHTRKEWRRWENTLEKSGEDTQIYSKRVEKI